MSTIAMSGLYDLTFSSRSSAVPLWPDDLESLALEQTGDALAQKHGVVGKDDADGPFASLLILVLDVDARQCRRKADPRPGRRSQRV